MRMGKRNPTLANAVCHHLARFVMPNGDIWNVFFLSFVMPNGDPQDGLFYTTLTLMFGSYIIAKYFEFTVNVSGWSAPALTCRYFVTYSLHGLPSGK